MTLLALVPHAPSASDRLHLWVGAAPLSLLDDVTGHSKGGALASTLALWLAETQGEQLPATERCCRATVHCYSYAGVVHQHMQAYLELLGLAEAGVDTMELFDPLGVLP